MPNRYSDFSDHESRRGDGGDWFAQNQITVAPGGMAGPGPTITPTPAGGSTPAPFGTGTTWDAGQGWTGQAAVGGPEQFGGNYEQWFRSLVGDRPWNQQTLNALMPTLSHYGIKLTPANASGDQTKIQLPTGEWVRVGFGEGHPVWIPQTDAQGRSLFGPSAGAGGAGGYAGLGAIPPPFHAPSMQDLQNEPGYQARYQMGLQGLERGAAAHGSLLSGGTQKALARYGQEYASNEYSNAYNRALGTYNTNWQTQSLDPWRRYQDLYQGGLSAIGTSKTQTPIFAS